MKLTKQDFPIFAHHPDLVYLDSAATSLKPASVIAKNVEYYEQYSANIARGLYSLSEQATTEYEKTREMTAELINAKPEEIIFTRGTTESINLLSYSLESRLKEGDEILVTIAEHHSNFLPWQALALRTKATLKILELDADGQVNFEDIKRLITPRTKIFALTFVSNVLGTIHPVKDIISTAKAINPEILTIIDAAQAIAHLPIDVQNLNCDFLAFSSHKMFGPTGVGVLYGKLTLLEAMTPFQYGGEMVLEAKRKNSVFKNSPHKFEAGTPDIAGVIAFQEAIKYLQTLGYGTIRTHELDILNYASDKLQEAFGDAITLFGTKDISKRSGVIAFSLAGIHPHDIAQMLGEQNICIRAGQHCTTPLHDTLGLPATARLSVSMYTDRKDIAKFIEELKKIQGLFEK
ncbi:MAG: SufS family cysteine desulfurase [Candidatus Moranbacteria bacterium]|nr:SufS family cysteine desulfurase [Candidatus Moranbacteria bacterium]